MLIAYESVILQPNGRLMNDNKRHHDMFSQATDTDLSYILCMDNIEILYRKNGTETSLLFYIIEMMAKNINIINHKSIAYHPSLLNQTKNYKRPTQSCSISFSFMFFHLKIK